MSWKEKKTIQALCIKLSNENCTSKVVSPCGANAVLIKRDKSRVYNITSS